MSNIKDDYKRKLKIAKFLDRILLEFKNDHIDCSRIEIDELHIMVDACFVEVVAGEGDEDCIIQVTLTNKVINYLIGDIHGASKSTIDTLVTNVGSKIWLMHYKYLIDTVVKVSTLTSKDHGITGEGDYETYPHYLGTRIVTDYISKKLTLQEFTKWNMTYGDDFKSVQVTEQNIEHECINILNMLGL